MKIALFLMAMAPTAHCRMVEVQWCLMVASQDFPIMSVQYQKEEKMSYPKTRALPMGETLPQLTTKTMTHQTPIKLH